jgi:hypothetical protein
MSTLIKELVGVRPNFLFIGADRCGSKSLHQIFRQHPECYVPSIADPYFFDRHYDRGMDWYLGLFAAASPTARAIGEFSHDYLQSPEAAVRIATELPDVKLLVTLRHPIDRLFSSYASAVSAGVVSTPLEQAIEDVPWFIGNSFYADRLQVYYDLFPRDALKVLFFEDLQANPRAFADQAFRHVGLNAIDGIDYDSRYSQLSKSRWPLAGKATKVGANTLRRLGWVNLLGHLKSNAAFRSLFYKPLAAEERPSIDPETRKRLSAIFAPQIDRLEVMLGRDLTSWRS